MSFNDFKETCKGDTKYMKDFNPEEESTFITYLDAKDLH